MISGKTLAIITARGGSKRIPGKNIKPFCGRPIISYSITAALESGLFDEVMVSTDSAEIRDLAVSYGASCPFMRTEENSGDFATTADVIKEVLTEYERLGRKFERYCVIYPTAPFITAERLREAFRILEDAGADFLTPVAAFSQPVFRGFVIEPDGQLKKKWPEYQNVRTQDLPKLYYDCGEFYIGSAEKIFTVPYEERNMVAMVLPEEEVQDIDTPSDWLTAEEKYRKLFGKREESGIETGTGDQ